MLDKVKNWAVKHGLLVPGSRIVAACSGGPDSLVLVHVLNRLKEECHFSLAVAHVNHMFRAEAAAEADFVAAFSASLGLECHVKDIDVPAYLADNKMSPQEAARLLRYRYLREVAAQWGGAHIATGHHRDDQVETVLINLLRGAGSSGLKGMRPRSEGIIRPLLAVSRPEIETYCARHNLTPCQDSSNFKTDYLRNRIRLKLLPTLEQDYNPAIREALLRLAELTGDEHDYICREAAKQWGTSAIAADGNVCIDSGKLAELHAAVQRELIRQAIEKKRGSLTGISFSHVEKLLTMALSGTVGAVLTLPGGLIARKTYTGFELEMAGAPHDLFRRPERLQPVEVAVPGVTPADADGRVVVLAEIFSSLPERQGRDTALFDLERLKLPLIMRSRLPGDRFRPLGLGGSKKLKEFLIDAKVPEAERDNVPVIADQDNIIWVAGYRQSEHGRISGQTQKFLKLTIKQGEF
ncbi:tRNA(Ile)-lysidine synthase [Sporomusa carbonis]|uniref:tRNA lysidine(34) synthetase TilS n=1 Tax=Sporomusa carbonis TaxID=3076075 RepID=UPI003A5F8C8B